MHLAAAICGLSAESILVSDLDNAKQCVDPLCPRFLLAMETWEEVRNKKGGRGQEQKVRRVAFSAWFKASKQRNTPLLTVTYMGEKQAYAKLRRLQWLIALNNHPPHVLDIFNHTI